jgi:protease-4
VRSGGYYIAVAADKIYVNKASLIGSVGVLMDGFGFTGLMDKLGVERRLLTAGENRLPRSLQPAGPKQREYAQSMLQEIHQQFIDVVRQGRGAPEGNAGHLLGPGGPAPRQSNWAWPMAMGRSTAWRAM